MPAESSQALAIQIKQKARSIGFELVGIASAEPSKYQEYLRHWLDDGQAGNMAYLQRRFTERVDVSTYFPGAKSVICVAANYANQLDEASADPSAKVARYALADDYHDIIKSRLFALADWLKGVEPSANSRCAVDTAPVMEKELAARAGIGWIGKNTCVIHPYKGSWLLLGEVITNLDLPNDEPAIDRCGTCTRCLDACPTQAFTAPYQMDARKCISYLTIEHPDPLSEPDQKHLHDWIFGCDICQDVCPWNSKAGVTGDIDFIPKIKTGSLNLNDLLQWNQESYQAQFRKSPIRRVKLPVLQRNAQTIILNRSGEK